ncbi:hypothetical protein BKA67DRAFT_255468 [Truncatella angustata]|uniref:Secreted protein n=1 Tax=Truncatella angustata TaxID=152316 RepID=A0A9P8UQ66_9PEZI|nr:uncharacterized protein BKA67DRAFT_255468 [Truncatella angustata]KAH6656096.1 hypothetical protein BKA67DRAFT_255468 [Truncatella angustata]
MSIIYSFFCLIVSSNLMCKADSTPMDYMAPMDCPKVYLLLCCSGPFHYTFYLCSQNEPAPGDSEFNNPRDTRIVESARQGTGIAYLTRCT